MSPNERLRAEIATVVETLVNEDRVLRPEWIAHSICEAHLSGLSSEETEDRQFWQHSGYRTVRSETGEYLRREFGKARPDNDRQHILPGFDHVQTHYIVKRDDDELAVPVQEMTDDEIDAVIATMRATAASLYAHADELERLKELRSTSAAE